MTRIAFYIDALKLGGAERVTLQWASWCLQEGWSVTVITRRPTSQDVYPLPGGLERQVEPPLHSLLEGLGWWAFPLRILQLRRMLRQGRFQYLVGLTTLPSVKLLLASRGLPASCVVSERNYPPAKPPALLWRLLRRLTYRWADLHLVQTDQTGAWLRHHCNVRLQQKLPNAVHWPLPRHEPLLDPATMVPLGAPLLLAAGTKARQKGFDRLMPMFRALATADPDLRLAIPGIEAASYHGHNQQDWLRELLGADQNLQERLILPGAVGNLGDWYARATLFLLPSRYEGFPNVLLEAMAAGCTCVAADCYTGPADLIRDGENGVLLPPNADANAWSSAVRELLDQAQRRERLGLAAQGVRHRFAVERLRHQFLRGLEDSSHGR